MGTYQGVGGSSDPPAQPFGPIKTSSFRARDRQRPMWRASLPIAKHFCWTRHGKLLPDTFWQFVTFSLKTFHVAIVEGLETVLKLHVCLRRRGDFGRRIYAPRRPGGRTGPFARNPRVGKRVNPLFTRTGDLARTDGSVRPDAAGYRSGVRSPHDVVDIVLEPSRDPLQSLGRTF